jgi:hypothetical protein
MAQAVYDFGPGLEVLTQFEPILKGRRLFERAACFETARLALKGRGFSR